MSKVTVFDLETQSWVNVDSERAAAGVASGEFAPPEGGVQVQSGGSAGAGTAVRSLEGLDDAEAVGDTLAPELASAIRAAAIEEARREAFDTLGDKALTFAEGVVDAASLGLIHEHGPEAAIRRDVNAGSALLGQLAGTAASLGFGGPVRAVATGSAKVGRSAANVVLKEAAREGAAAKIITRGAEEAAIGAGLMGSTAFGHQVSDAIVEDKALAGEAIISEMGLGALMGFGAGALSGGFSAAASRNAIKGQGGLVDGASASSKSLADEIAGVKGAWKEASHQFEQRVGVLEALKAKGVIDDAIVAPYQDAARRARRALQELDGYNIGHALDASPEQYARFRKAIEAARREVDDAGMVFNSPPSAARRKSLPTDQPVEAPRTPVTGHVTGGGEWARHLDELMLRDPEALAAYERMHGRPYEPLGGRAENVVTPSSLEKTNPGGRAKKVVENNGFVERVNGGVTGAFERGELRAAQGRRPMVADDAVPPSGEYTQVTPEGIPTRAVDNADTLVTGAPKDMPVGWQPSAPKGKFSLDDFSDDTLAGEGRGFRRLEPADEAPDLLNHNYGARELGLFPDGYLAPSRDIAANAEAFAQFRQRAAFDTITPAPAPAPTPDLPPSGPSTVKDWNVAKGDGNRTARSGKPDMEAPPSDKTVRDANVPKGEPALPDKTYKDPYVEKGSKKAKSEAAGDEALEETLIREDGATQVRPRPGSAEWSEFQKKAAQDYVEKWYWEAHGSGVRINPADEAAARMDQALRRISELSGGRLDSAGALEIGEQLGLQRTDDMFVDRLDQIWALRKAAKFAADEARGIATPLRRSGNALVDEVARRAMAKAGAAALGGALGGPLGGAAGWVLGKHAAGMMGFGARAAAASGRIMGLAVKTGESLLRGRRATLVARSLAGNRAYSYDETGPIKDPVERIQKIHQMAANPEQIRANVRNQLGDAALASPQIAAQLEDAAVRQITNLSMKAPAIYFDQLGRALQPTAQALRKFHEYENATHDVTSLLNNIARGGITPVSMQALQEQHAAVHSYVTRTLLSDPEQLKKLPTAQLRSVEAVVGVPLSYATSQPGYVARTQQLWQAPLQQQAQDPGAAQAFKISAPAPTPSQAGATAPGNQ